MSQHGAPTWNLPHLETNDLPDHGLPGSNADSALTSLHSPPLPGALIHSILKTTLSTCHASAERSAPTQGAGRASHQLPRPPTLPALHTAPWPVAPCPALSAEGAGGALRGQVSPWFPAFSQLVPATQGCEGDPSEPTSWACSSSAAILLPRTLTTPSPLPMLEWLLPGSTKTLLSSFHRSG